jgi:Fe-S cluster biogenesis protein NfuA
MSVVGKKLENALETIHFALMGYCEDCISSEPSEQKKIDRAYQTIIKALEDKKNEIQNKS